MTRREFPVAVRKAAWDRAAGVCECGCGRPFGKHPKERPVYDHAQADYLGGEPTLENCRCVRLDCHETKTAVEDMPRIKKVRRETKRQTGTERTKQRLPGSKDGKWKRKLNGEVVPR